MHESRGSGPLEADTLSSEHIESMSVNTLDTFTTPIKQWIRRNVNAQPVREWR